MKKLAILVMVLSLSVFSIGCGGGDDAGGGGDDTKKTEEKK